eukprot:Lithocolla_globosa_v1_NODE_8565_length_806_cov_62.936085.p2 type:complete len:128 gc:universal NODE_8565_length_806_cov_62.936085:344-727(+)
MVADFRVPFCFDVFKRRRAHNGETNQKDISLGVRQRPKTIVILLSSCIPKPKVNGFSVHHHVGRVVIKNCWDVFTRKSISGVGNKLTCFTDGTIADDDTLDRLHYFALEVGRKKKREKKLLKKALKI